MALGDILFASGFDSRDPGIGDLVNANGFGNTSPLRYQSLYYISSATDIKSTLAATGIKEFVVGYAIYWSTITNANHLIMVSPNATDNVAVGTNASGQIVFKRGSTVLATGTTVLSSSAWHWVWFYTLIADASPGGKYKVLVDGVQEIALATGADTRADAGASGDTCDRITYGINGAFRIDDLYVIDATGTSNNGTDCDPGEVTIPFLLPNADGDTVTLTPSTGTDHYALVDEVPPNDDTDYNSHTTVGNLDLYNLQATTSAASVKGVVSRARVKKTDAGAKSYRHILKSGGTTSNDSDKTPASTYSSTARHMRKNPVTAADWVVSDVDALQVGVEVRT